MCTAVLMTIGKEMKKLFSKPSRKDETSQSMASTGTLHRLDHVDLDLVSDGILFAQDFRSWFGKSIFEGTLAEIIQKEHAGNRTFSLIDVVELVAATYAQDATELNKGDTDSKPTYSGLYSQIYSTRYESDDAEWADFRQKLWSRISTSCARLRNEKIPELHAISMPRPSGGLTAPTPTTNNGAEASASSSSSSMSSFVSPHHQPVVSSSATMNKPPQAQQALQPLANPAIAPKAAVDIHRYTSALKEYGDIHGKLVVYQKKCLTHSPVSWHCTATFGDVAGEGIGRSIQLAKHNASRQICEVLGLLVD